MQEVDYQAFYTDELERLEIDYKERRGEIVVELCPFCEGGQHRDKHTFSINVEKGIYNCQRAGCYVKGNIISWNRHFGNSAGPIVIGPRQATTKPRRNFTSLAQEYAEALRDGHAAAFAAYFGVSVDTVRKVGVGYSKKHRMFSMPMYSPNGKCYGISLRAPGGQKISVIGSEFDSLFGAENLPHLSKETLILFEGFSDYLKAVDDGVKGALGRHSAKSEAYLSNLGSFFANKQVVLATDNDSNEETRQNVLAAAESQAEKVERLGASHVSIWSPDEEKDYRDWRKKEGVGQFLWECVQPRARQDNSLKSLKSPVKRNWPKPPAPEAYHGLAGEIVRLIEPHTESDPIAILIQLLVAYGNVIGRNPYFLAEATKHFLNVYVVVVGETSKGRKGTSWGHVKKLFVGVDPEWVADRIFSGLSSGEGLISIVQDKIPEDLISDDKRILLYESEFAAVLRVLKREGNTLSPIFREAWDGDTLRVLTRKDPLKATNTHISLVGHITKDELVRCLSETEIGNGFGNRIVWVCTKRSKLLPEGGKIHTANLNPLITRLKQAVRFGTLVKELKRSPDARELWIQIYETLSQERPGDIGALTARAEAQVMRLASIYALLDCSPVIQKEHLKAAYALWEYIERSVEHIFDGHRTNPDAEKILYHLGRKSPAGMTTTEIIRLFANKRTPDVHAALKEQQDEKFITLVETKTAGRTSKAWYSAAKKAN